MSHGIPQPPIDPQGLDRMAEMLGPESLLEVMDLILESAPALADQLRDAARQGDGKTVARAAHQLRSNCTYMGARVLAGKLEDLELRAAEGGLREGEGDEVHAEITRFMTALRDERARRGGGREAS